MWSSFGCQNCCKQYPGLLGGIMQARGLFKDVVEVDVRYCSLKFGSGKNNFCIKFMFPEARNCRH